MSDTERPVDTATPEEVPSQEESEAPPAGPTPEEVAALEALEAERRAAIDAEIDALPEGALKAFRTHGLPGTVYKMDGDKRVEVSLETIIEANETFAIYFSASWCDPCKEFTPKLVEAYNDMKEKQKGGFEILLCPVDKTVEDHAAYFEQMPWYSMDFSTCGYFRTKLCDSFKLEAIPTLVICDAKTGEVNTIDGCDAIVRDGMKQEQYPWKGYARPWTERIQEFIISKLPMFGMMAFMMYRNYSNLQTAQTATSTTTMAVEAVVETVKAVIGEEL